MHLDPLVTNVVVIKIQEAELPVAYESSGHGLATAVEACKA